MSGKRGSSRIFWCFALFHALAWSLVPTLTRQCYRDDVLEQFSLAREWSWASSKHPNFPAWVLQTFNLLTDYAYGVPYFLAQAFVLAALFALWRFGRQIVSETAAVFGALVFCLFVYCNGRTVEYNHTTTLVSLWCVALCLLYGALRWDKLRYWIATGILLGIGLNTFFMVFNLCFAILVFMFWNPVARSRWKGIGPYLTLAIAVAFFLPQVFHMLDTHNTTGWNYVSHRTTMGGSISHLTSPLYFLGGQLLIVLPMVIALLPLIRALSSRKRGQEGGSHALKRTRLFRPLTPEEMLTSRFLLFFTFFPFACFLLYCILVGGHISVRYGAQLWSLVGLLILFHFERNESWQALKRSGILMLLINSVILVFIAAEALVVPFFLGPSFDIDFPMHEFGQQTQTIWNRLETEPCPFVGGEYRLAAAAGITMPDHPRVHANLKDDANYAKKTAFSLHSDEELNHHGGVILWTNDGRSSYPNGVPSNLLNRYPTAEVQPSIRLTVNIGRQTFPIEIGTAVVRKKISR